MNVDEEEEIDLPRLKKILRLENTPVEALTRYEELVKEPKPETNEQIYDDENDPHQLNRGRGRRKRVKQCEFYSFLRSICDYFNKIHGTITHSVMDGRFLRQDGCQPGQAQPRISGEASHGSIRQSLGLLTQSRRETLTVESFHVLPWSFVESTRVMKQAYQDAIAICGKFMKPVFFLTFTCNSN